MPEIHNDNEMVAGLREGNKIVIDQIYHSYHKRIYAFALSLLKVDDDAQDIVHEVFVKLWNHRHELEPNSKIESLIFTITRNVVLSLFRKQATENKYRNHIISENDKETGEQNTENLVDYNLLKEKIEILVNQLPSKSRHVYILSREQGLSNREIAEKLNIAEKTVENHITRALAFLKKHLHEIGIMGMLFWFLFVG